MSTVNKLRFRRSHGASAISANNLVGTFSGNGTPVVPFSYDVNIPDGAAPGDKDEFERKYHTFTFKSLEVKKPFTRDFDILDDMFDAVLLMKAFGNGADRKTLGKEAEQEVGRNAKAQVFPLAPSPPLARPKDDVPSTKDKKYVEIFPAYLKALQFFYLRFLLRAGIYDLPMFSLTVEDVDRLFCCGMIDRKHLDHVFLVSMLGHGAFRRYLRTQGLAQIDHSVAPPPGLWTIPEGTRRPTRDDVFRFIADCENFRFRRPYARPGFRLASFERPKMTREYHIHRIQRDGLFGLKRMTNLSDNDLEILFDPPDPMFIPSGRRLDALRSRIELADSKTDQDIPTVLGLRNAVWEGENDLDDEDRRFYTSVAGEFTRPFCLSASSLYQRRASISSAEEIECPDGTGSSCSPDEEVRSGASSCQSLSWPICVPTYGSEGDDAASETTKPSFFSPEDSPPDERTSIGALSACKSRNARPPAQSTGNPSILYDPYFDKNFHRPKEGRELHASDYIIIVQENIEKSPKYALLYDLIIPSWAERCSRWKLPPPYRQLGHGTNPTIDPELIIPGPSSIVPFNRRPRRHGMTFLHKVYPRFHPHPNALGSDGSLKSTDTEIVESSNPSPVPT